MVCDLCKRFYPEGLVQPFLCDDVNKGVLLQICPLCALYKMREVHQDETMMFETDFTLHALNDALQYLKTVPSLTEVEKTRINNLFPVTKKIANGSKN